MTCGSSVEQLPVACWPMGSPGYRTSAAPGATLTTHTRDSESRLGVWLARFGKACQLANSRLDKFPLRPCPPVALRARTLDLWQQPSCQPATCGPADISSRPVLNLAASAALPSSAQLSPLDTKIANPLIRRGS
ncbi:uncharacterized protein UMAG_01041 [Mycosarcoma maydis]|uniref:Uncharacterized protein n=1 Tax=Mycosarcoma maydis TaxID=5270 RepID=A0A0D1E6D7_MYCMD|nr:uncharacterized protein UMAG_01041 [Ustilago maydis 521]KIS71131.1 hypothetical protein UMAG_01041 [Ustilago maydis 521]|eukprot:XP_011387012.1 hypothetical protein UMAG_01041 [Ustilago maydis 521]